MELKRKITVLTLFAVLICSAVSAQSGNHTEVRNSLQEAERSIQAMEDSDIPVERVQSLLRTANTSFRAQKSLADQGGTPDFDRVRELTSSIQDIRETAFRVNDRLTALEKRIEELEDSNLNLSGVRTAFEEVNTTFHNQRFEEAENQVENVYSEISEAQSVQTQVQAFASAQRQNIVGTYNDLVDYAGKNWEMLSVGLIVSLIVAGIGKREYTLWRLEKSRENMIQKKEVIEDMIEQAQHEYYVKGKGSEISFNTRMEKFQEMKRDTEQEINEAESKLKSIQGLPVISPEIKDRSEEFKAEGEIMEENGEVKGSLERIKEKREEKSEEEENNGDKEKDEEQKSEEKKEDRLEDKAVKDIHEEVLDNPLNKAKDLIEEDDLDYYALLKAEKGGKDRQTMKEYLKEHIK